MALSVAFSMLFGAFMAGLLINLFYYAAYAILYGDFMQRLAIPALGTLWLLSAMAFYAWAE